MKSTRPTLGPLARALCFLTRLSARHPRVVVLAAVALTLASGMALQGLEMRTGKLDLAPQDDPFTREYLDFMHEFGNLNRLLCVLEGPRIREATDALVSRLRADTEQVGDARGRVDLDRYVEQYLWTLPLPELRRLRQRVQDARLDLIALAEDPALATLLERMGRRGSRARPPDAGRVRALARMLRWVGGASHLKQPDPTSLFGAEDEALDRPPLVGPEGYLLSKSRHKSLISVQSRQLGDSHAVVVPFVEAVRAHGRAVEEEFGVRVRYTGLPVLKVVEKREAESSLRRSGLFSLVTVSLLFLLVFRAASLPLMAVLCLSASIVWTLAWARLSIGHLTLVSSSFTAILIGLGIDFAIHLIARFEVARGECADPGAAVEAAAVHAVPGILTGCLTTSAAFFSMLLTGFPAFQGLGVIAGGGILLALVETFSLLPAVIVLRTRPERCAPEEQGPVPFEGAFARLGEQLVAIPSLGLLVGLGLGIVFLEPAMRLPFDRNVLAMNSPDSDPMRLQETMVEDFGFFPVLNVVVTESREALAEATRLLGEEEVVGTVDSVSRLLPHEPERLREEVEKVREVLAPVPALEVPALLDQGRREEAARVMLERGADLRLLFLSLGDAEGALAAQELLDAVRALVRAPTETVDTRERALLRDLGDLVEDLRAAARSEPATLEDIPAVELDRYRSADGRWAVFGSPALDVRRPVEAQRFNAAFRAVAAKVGAETTGNVILSQRVIHLLEVGYRDTCLYALLTVTLLLLLDLRRPDLGLLSLGAVGLGVVATRGSMTLFGVDLSPANFVAMPLLLGVGVDNTVHLIHPWLRGASTEETVATSGRPVALNAATSMLGFGGLLVAEHPGMYSLGWAMTVGVFWCCVAAFLVVPSATELFEIDRTRWRRLFDEALSHRYP